LLYKGYIFDLDGVLIDSSRIHFEGWRKFLNEVGRDVDYETFLKSYFGKRGAETLEQIFGRGKYTPGEAREISDRIDFNFVMNIGKQKVPIEGAFEFLRTLKGSGQKIALATSAPRQNVDAFLDAFSVRNFFDAEVCADDVSHGKPDPEVFLRAAGKLGESPSDCIVFEDSLPGLMAAKAAGMKCVAVLTTTTREVLNRADFFITNFNDKNLKQIFGSTTKEIV